MNVTFVAHSTTYPSGGILGIYEFAGGLSRLGHDVHVVHRRHPYAHEWIQSVDEISWFRFDERIQHSFVEDLETYPHADFILSSMTYGRIGGRPPRHCGLPVMLVQGDLTGTDRLAPRMRAAFPKVCVAKWLIDIGRHAGVPDDQLVHVPYGIRHDVFRLTAPSEGRPLQVSMLYHAHPHKGARFGIDALEEVKQRIPKLKAVLFGTRDPEPPVPKWITYVRSPDREVLVRDIYNRSRVFLQSSNREGFGFTPVEAMACGCALVTTANGGSDDYAIDGLTALVAQPRDVNGMAKRIEQLLVDDDTRIRLAVQGNEHVQRFNWDASARLLEAFLGDYQAAPGKFQQPPRHMVSQT